MNRDFIAKHWYAYIYEQQENQTGDAFFLLDIMSRENGGKPLKLLEIACGGGRLTVPFAQAGHDVTGFDGDEHMLLRCYARANGLSNLRMFKADAVSGDYGTDYDAVVMAGNFLINIESESDYAEAQQAIIRKASNALRPGGFLLMDFDIHFAPDKVFSGLKESSYFNGVDDLGTQGRTVSYGGVYDPVTRICTGAGHTEITTNNGESFVIPRIGYKHIPSQEQVWAWLADAGLSIERSFRNYTQEPVPVPLTEGTFRATLLARKAE